MYIPVKLKPDAKARGWKPSKGWYCFDTKIGCVNMSRLETTYLTKKECKVQCERLNIDSSEK